MKAESTEFVRGVGVGYEEEIGVRDDSKEFGLSNHKKRKSCHI